MGIIIKEVSNNRELKKFISFPYKLYAESKYWIPPLISEEKDILRKDKNPAFDFCKAKYWLAIKDGKVAGRIACIINPRFIEKWKKNYARFGWIDFIDDKNVSKALFDKMETWAKEMGMSAVHGPLGFTDLDPEGMLIEGFDELGTIATIYNYPYYPEHLKECGYKKDTDWVEFEVKVPDKLPEKIERIASIVKKKNKLYVLKATKKKDLIPYTKEIFYLINEAYEPLYGVVHLTEKQIEKYIKQYFGMILPDFVSIILDEQNKIAGFGITMPSMSRAFQKAKGKLFPFGFFHILKALKKTTRVDMYLVAVRPDLQSKGVNAILFNEFFRVFVNKNIINTETNPELETNNRVKSLWKFFEHRQHKRRRCYIKKLKKIKVGKN